MKKVLSLKQINKQLPYPERRKGNTVSPGLSSHQREPFSNTWFKAPPRPFSKLVFIAMSNLERHHFGGWKTTEQYKIGGVGLKSIKLNETLSQHYQMTGQLENISKLKAKQGIIKPKCLLTPRMKQIAVITSLESSGLHKSWYIFSVREVIFLSLYSAEQQEYLLLYFSL